jgi:hypothetical protein
MKVSTFIWVVSVPLLVIKVSFDDIWIFTCCLSIFHHSLLPPNSKQITISSWFSLSTNLEVCKLKSFSVIWLTVVFVLLWQILSQWSIIESSYKHHRLPCLFLAPIMHKLPNISRCLSVNFRYAVKTLKLAMTVDGIEWLCSLMIK